MKIKIYFKESPNDSLELTEVDEAGVEIFKKWYHSFFYIIIKKPFLFVSDRGHFYFRHDNIAYCAIEK